MAAGASASVATDSTVLDCASDFSMSRPASADFSVGTAGTGTLRAGRQCRRNVGTSDGGIVLVSVQARTHAAEDIVPAAHGWFFLAAYISRNVLPSGAGKSRPAVHSGAAPRIRMLCLPSASHLR